MLRENQSVLLDACVLATFSVCDLYLRLAEDAATQPYIPKWSAKILDEAYEALVGKITKPWPEEIADTWREQIEITFPEAIIARYEDLIPTCENDPDDRHVLAAARKADVNAIVTFNLKHFPRNAVEPWGITSFHPGEYLSILFERSPGLMISKIDDIAAKQRRTREEILSRLKRHVPLFADQVANTLGIQSR